MNITSHHPVMQWIQRSGWRYAMAVGSTACAFCARLLLHPWLNEECPYSLFYLSVLLTAWIAGTGPAIVAIVLGTFSAAHFVIEPASSLYIEDFPDFVQLSIYVFVNCVATLLFNRVERQRCLAENRSAENERLSQSLRLADERKDEFLALLAHELRNPLAPIRSSLSLLDRKDDCPEVVGRVREIIRRQTNHLVRITDDLLDVSRFCRGKVELQVLRLDLRDAICDAVEMTETLFEDKSHRFQLLMPQHPVWVDGDRVRLAQLTSNLLGNAAKYTPDGGRITLQVEELDGVVAISVADNGIGFAPNEARYILEPFMQIDTSRTREYGGLGVGLAIVDRLVALHGGTLIPESRGPGLGSRFTVNLPAVASASLGGTTSDDIRPLAESRDVTVAPALPVIRSPGTSRRSVLIVEDNADASQLLGELFECEGYDVTLACDGVEALQEVNRHSPDVIILDIGLPGMDGYEIARRIRRQKTAAHARLIALTGWGGPQDRELAAQAGFDIHLVKPIVFRELLEHAEGEHPADALVGESPRHASLV